MTSSAEIKMSERTPGRVEDKVAIVTGGASGIGRACAGLLASEGGRVLLTDIDSDRGARAIKEIGGNAAFIPHDVSAESQWESVIAAAEARFGRLDILINNAGIVKMGTIEDATVDEFLSIQSVNALGVFLGCKHAIPAMRRSGGGSIVNVSSLAALRGTPIYAAYAASKGAVHALTKTVAAHCIEKGDAIRCNSIHPGGVDTPMVHGVVKQATGLDLANLDDDGATARSMAMAQPLEIAYLALYLASDESRFMNGSALSIDGGMSARTGPTGPRS
jgi:3(or 17)beta-hydroxysteroid dehydrogenase